MGLNRKLPHMKTAILPVELQRHASAPNTALFHFWSDYPGPRISRKFARKGAAVPEKTFPEIRFPLGPQSRPVRQTSSRRSAKADCAVGLCPGEAQKPTTAVVFPRPRLLAVPAAGKTARFLITRGKASFYETATFGRRKVFFCSPFCGLLFCPTRAKLALPAGEKPAAPKPRPPRGGPAQRPRPAPGFCAASANARPGDPAPVCLLEKALWVPPTTEPFRPAPSGKPERKKERRNPG